MDYMDFYDESGKNPDALPVPEQEPEEEESTPTVPPHGEE